MLYQMLSTMSYGRVIWLFCIILLGDIDSAVVPETYTTNSKIDHLLKSYVIFSGRYFSNVLKSANLTVESVILTEKERSISLIEKGHSNSTFLLYPHVELPATSDVVYLYSNISFPNFWELWENGPELLGKGVSSSICTRQREYAAKEKSKHRSACSYFGGFCSHEYQAQMRHCHLLEEVPLGGGLVDDEHVNIIPESSYLIVATNVSILNRGGLIWPHKFAGFYQENAALSSIGFYSDAKNECCGLSISNCRLEKVVLVTSQFWQFEYGHFLSENLPRIILHYKQLKKQFPNIKLQMTR